MASQTVSLKIPLMKSEACAENLKGIVSKVEGVKTVKVDLPVRNLIVTFDPDVGTLTAVHKALDVADHPHASFAAGTKKRGWN